MTLYLYEIAPHHGDRSDADRVLKEVDALVHRAGGELIEAQVTGGTHRVFAIAEFALQQAVPLDAAALNVADVSGPRQVRLVGADLGQLKAVAKPFYDRLKVIGYGTKQNLIDRGYPPDWQYDYPWDPNAPVSQKLRTG